MHRYWARSTMRLLPAGAWARRCARGAALSSAFLLCSAGPALAQSAPCGAPREYIYAGSRLLAVVQPQAQGPTVSFTSTDLQVEEGAGEILVPVRLTTHDCNGTPSGVNARFGFANGSAMGGVDFTAVPAELHWEPGEPSVSEKALRVPIAADADVEESEYFRVILQSADGATVADPREVRIWIADDDTPRVSFVASEARVREDGSWSAEPPAPALRIVTGDGRPLASALQVGFTRTDETAQSDDVSLSQPSPVVVDAGSPAGSIPFGITPVQDDVIEGDESLSFELRSGPGYLLSEPSTLHVTVEDDDVSAPLAFYNISPCRLLDTRTTGAALGAGGTRAVQVGGACGVPIAAKAVIAGVTAVSDTAAGHLTTFIQGAAAPGTTILDFSAGEVIAGGGHLMLGADGRLTLLASLPQGATVHVVVDVFGYFQ